MSKFGSKAIRVVLLALFVFVFLVCWRIDWIPRSIYYLPEHYEGQAMVFYGVPGGDQVVIEDGKKIHRFPPNGVLFYSEPLKTGWSLEPLYFILKPQGSVREIQEVENMSSPEPAIYFPRVGTIESRVGSRSHKQTYFTFDLIQPDPQLSSLKLQNMWNAYRFSHLRMQLSQKVPVGNIIVLPVYPTKSWLEDPTGDYR